LERIAWVSAFGLAIGLLLFPRLDALSASIGPVIDETHPQVAIYRVAPALLLLVVALMPVFEEWLFRGCLMRLLEDKKGPLIALLASSALFGLFHTVQPGAYPLAFISPFFAGLVFGWCYLAQGLTSAVAAHSGYNVAVFALWWLR
jgi:membrane protease YdiL (CAAX protease family)